MKRGSPFHNLRRVKPTETKEPAGFQKPFPGDRPRSISERQSMSIRQRKKPITLAKTPLDKAP